MTMVDGGRPARAAGAAGAARAAGGAGQVPVVVGINLDDNDRRQLAAALDGVSVLVFAPDLAWLEGAVVPSRNGRSKQRPAERVVRRGALEVDLVRCRARWRDSWLPLTQRERALLACLAGEPVRVWSYRELYAAAWPGSYLDPGPVHAAVKRLRRKLREAGAAVRIEAVRGIGYELVETG